MKFNEDLLNGKWLEIKGDIQKTWGKITSDELEKTKGDIKAIQGLLQQKYGQTKDSYGEKVSNIFKRFEAKKDQAFTAIKSALK